jgi:hypothetical protein
MRELSGKAARIREKLSAKGLQEAVNTATPAADDSSQQNNTEE